jgi:anti-sigma factor RsiW
MLDNDYKNIEAFVDGELKTSDQQRIIKKMSDSPELVSYYKKIRLQKKLLLEWWKTQKRH